MTLSSLGQVFAATVIRSKVPLVLHSYEFNDELVSLSFDEESDNDGYYVSAENQSIINTEISEQRPEST